MRPNSRTAPRAATPAVAISDPLAYAGTASPRTATVTADGADFLVRPGVYPTGERGGAVALLHALGALHGKRVMDMGCGTGVVGIGAAKRGAAHVTMCDAHKDAVDNARINAVRLGVAESCDARHSDLFGAVRYDELFDLVLFDMPRPASRRALGTMADGCGPATRPAQGHDAVVRRFCAVAAGFLTPAGVIRCAVPSSASESALRAVFSDSALHSERLGQPRADRDGALHSVYELTPTDR